MNEPPTGAPTVLDTYRQEAGLSPAELWMRYFEMGGMSTGVELDAYLSGVLVPSPSDRTVIAHVLNERLRELGEYHPVRYGAEFGG